MSLINTSVNKNILPFARYPICIVDLLSTFRFQADLLDWYAMFHGQDQCLFRVINRKGAWETYCRVYASLYRRLSLHISYLYWCVFQHKRGLVECRTDTQFVSRNYITFYLPITFYFTNHHLFTHFKLHFKNCINICFVTLIYVHNCTY